MGNISKKHDVLKAKVLEALRQARAAEEHAEEGAEAHNE